MTTQENRILTTLTEGRYARLPTYRSRKNHNASIALIKHYFDFMLRTETLHRQLPARLARSLIGCSLGNVSGGYSWLTIYSILYPFISENDQIRIGNYPRPRTTLDVFLAAVGKVVLELTPIVDHYSNNSYSIPALEVALQAYADAALEGDVHPDFIADLCTIGRQLHEHSDTDDSCYCHFKSITYRFTGDNFQVTYTIPFAQGQYRNTLRGTLKD